MVLENGSFQALLGMEKNSLTKAFTEIAVFAFEMTGGTEASQWPIFTTFGSLGMNLVESQGAFRITL